MTREIGSWLSELGLGEYREKFVENKIDLDAARDLTEADLRELGIPMGSRKKLLRQPRTHRRPAFFARR